MSRPVPTTDGRNEPGAPLGGRRVSPFDLDATQGACSPLNGGGDAVAGGLPVGSSAERARRSNEMTTTTKGGPKRPRKAARKAARTPAKDLRASLLAVEADIGTVLIEREDETRSLLLALLSRQHLFLLGPPGEGKSLLCTEMTIRVTGAKVFDVLMARTTEPAEMYGPYSLAALRKRDAYERVGSGMMQDCHLAFIDEVWKANSAILNTLLPIINERLYREGGSSHKLELQSMVCASNELPQGDDLGAIYDRILFRHSVPTLSDSGLERLLLNPPRLADPRATISLDDLRVAQEEVGAVTITQETVDAVLRLRGALSGVKGVRVSSRRWRWALAAVKAVAWLEGRAETMPQDLLCLRNALWSDPADAGTVEVAVIDVAAPKLRDLRDHLGTAGAQLAAFLATTDTEMKLEHMAKLRSSSTKAKRLAADAGPEGRRIASRIAAMVREAKAAHHRALSAFSADDDDDLDLSLEEEE